MKRMIFDTSNVLFRVAMANSKYNTGTPEENAGLAMHSALRSFNKHYKKFKPDEVAITFEGENNWRKAFTKSAACKSKKLYKGNRVKDDSMIPFFELITAFEDLARNHTSLVCISNPVLEGDDSFAAYVQHACELGDEVIGVSGDKDFVQLLKYPNFKLINPDKGVERTVLDVCGVDDPYYFMFEKAIRGDSGDNVMSAYPRVQAKRLKKALEDDYELTKLMNETWSIVDTDTQEKTTFLVSELFEENNLLMNLEMQPEHIRVIMKETVQEALANRGSFSFFHFNKFCGKFGLKSIAEDSASFVNLFSLKGKPSAKEQQASSHEKSLLTF